MAGYAVARLRTKSSTGGYNHDVFVVEWPHECRCHGRVTLLDGPYPELGQAQYACWKRMCRSVRPEEAA